MHTILKIKINPKPPRPPKIWILYVLEVVMAYNYGSQDVSNVPAVYRILDARFCFSFMDVLKTISLAL